ncbi:hypothetical protein NIES2135_40950 [Leptolyngbya boryana NIES-2135]|jgi:hypothetical protein|uniref:Uncharacterized protein n=1 Tax=Leptolyngbya boryana NIES-2135 TaxID=1973484 RepID=A0A1Z4JKI5_LEPBY|nr:hypothetical protein NIES2135_40950 [Leptolyngbya boryana NIES-2135]
MFATYRSSRSPALEWNSGLVEQSPLKGLTAKQNQIFSPFSGLSTVSLGIPFQGELERSEKPVDTLQTSSKASFDFTRRKSSEFFEKPGAFEFQH